MQKEPEKEQTDKERKRKAWPAWAVGIAAVLLIGLTTALVLSGSNGLLARWRDHGAEPAPAETPAPAEPTPCPHPEWVGGVCAVCGEACGHQAWENGVCAVCGTVCLHPEWVDGVCAVCGTPCEHPAWEDSVCTRCGMACGHPAWEEDSCTVCGYICTHERHDPDSAQCLICGRQMAHSYRNARCVGCGREPMLTELALPESYYEPAEHQGTVVNDLFELNGYSHMVRVYLPYGYDESCRYNVGVFLHGGRGSIGDTIDTVFYSEGGELSCSQLYDHMIEDHLCEPFIVASVFTGDFDNMEASWLGVAIHDGLLPYLADTYSTYAASGSEEDLRAARMHFAIGGQSNGGRFACYSGMGYNFDYVANYFCFSAGPEFLERVVVPVVREYEEQGIGFGVFFDGAGAWEAKKLKTESSYRELVDAVDSLKDGENGFYVEVDHQHGWTSWFACYFNCLQLLFPAQEDHTA